MARHLTGRKHSEPQMRYDPIVDAARALSFDGPVVLAGAPRGAYAGQPGRPPAYLLPPPRCAPLRHVSRLRSQCRRLAWHLRSIALPAVQPIGAGTSTDVPRSATAGNAARRPATVPRGFPTPGLRLLPATRALRPRSSRLLLTFFTSIHVQFS